MDKSQVYSEKKYGKLLYVSLRKIHKLKIKLAKYEGKKVREPSLLMGINFLDFKKNKNQNKTTI